MEDHQAQRAAASGNAEAIKAAFHKWDSDGNGTICRYELMQVMMHLCHVSESDLEVLMAEVDANRDGDIDYTEFVDWLTKPPMESQGKALFDYHKMLEPVFDAYDLKGNGTITYDEFEECHCILQGALKLNGYSSEEEGDEDVSRERDPLQLSKDAATAFRMCDGNKDAEITFREFVLWMRAFIDQSQVEKDELTLLAARVGQMLQSSFKQMKIVEEAGERSTTELEALEVFINALARNTQALQTALRPTPERVPVIVWSEPPIGLSVDRLKAAHMKFYHLNLRQCAVVNFTVLCLPLPGGDEEPDRRTWLGEVFRKVKYESGRVFIEKKAYYVYERSRFQWVPLKTASMGKDAKIEKHAADVFQAALDTLAPELGIFFMLKTEANFGIELAWPNIERVLEGAVDMGFFDAKSMDVYVNNVRDAAREAIKADGFLTGDESEETVLVHIQDFLKNKVRLRPRIVMASLSEMGLVDINEAWQDWLVQD